MESYDALSRDSLVVRLLELGARHDELVARRDAERQELHDARKAAQFADELRRHLESELDACQTNEASTKLDRERTSRALAERIDELKRERRDEVERAAANNDALLAKIAALERERDEREQVGSARDESDSRLVEELRRAEDESATLRLALERRVDESRRLEAATEALERRALELEERLEAAHERVALVKDEREQLKDALLAAQESVCLANAELQSLKSAGNPHAVKGNSLFAEVDDKRQEMLTSLSQMKQKVYQLNRELKTKQAQIDSLLCEKKTLWEEYTVQANNHDKTLNNAYERRITDLEKQNDQLHRRVAQWFDKNLDATSSEIIQWVSGVLDYYKDENHKLSDEFAAISVDNLFKEQKIRELQRQLLTWRTKSIEAQATVSQLESKLQSLECPIRRELIEEQQNLKQHTFSNSLREECSDELEKVVIKTETELSVNCESEQNLSERVCKKPGILVNGITKNKAVKKTTFQ